MLMQDSIGGRASYPGLDNFPPPHILSLCSRAVLQFNFPPCVFPHIILNCKELVIPALKYKLLIKGKRGGGKLSWPG